MEHSDSGLIQKAEYAIWHLQPAEILQLPPLPGESWAGSVQSELFRFGIDARLPVPAVPGPAYLAACAVMMVKDEADIIRQNLSWLEFIGVRRFIILDNGSTDATLAKVRRFEAAHPQCEVVTLRDPTVAYVQSRKTTGLGLLAAQVWTGIRWIIPVDADEFLVAQDGLAMLDGVANEIDAITIPKVVHFLQSPREKSGAAPLAGMALRTPVLCLPPKVAVRAGRHLSIAPGNHGVWREDKAAARYQGGLGHGLYYREFQTRSYQQFRRKVVNGGQAIQAARDRDLGEGGDHWMHWFQVFQREGDAGLRQEFLGGCVRGMDPHFVVDPFLGRPADRRRA